MSLTSLFQALWTSVLVSKDIAYAIFFITIFTIYSIMEWNCLAYQVMGMWALECYLERIMQLGLHFVQKAQFICHTKIPILSQKGNKESVLSI